MIQKPLLASCLALVLLPSFASAQTLQLPFEGLLTGADDLPVSAAVTLEFRLYDQAMGGVPLYEERQDLMTSSGYVSAQIGTVTPLAASIFEAGANLFLGVTIVGAGQEPLKRQL